MSHLRNLLFYIFLITAISFTSCEGSIEPAGVIENEVTSLEDDTDTDGDSNSDDGNQESEGTQDSNDENEGQGNNEEGDSDSSDDSSGDDSSGNDSGNDSNDDGDGNTGNDNDSNDMDSILGEWDLISAEIEDGQASTVFNGGDIDFSFTSTSKDENAQLSFSENPNQVNGNGQFTSVISFTLFSQNFTEETIIESPITNGTWEINGNNLTIVDNDGITSEFSITSFTGNLLIVETSFIRSIVLDGLDVDTTGVLILEFAR